MNTVVAEQIRSTVEARMRELEPALMELDQLRGVLVLLEHPEVCRQLGDHADVSPTPPIAAHRGDRPDAAPTAAGFAQLPYLGGKPGVDGRAPQGANKQRILAVIAQHPGIAAPQIARLTGLKRPVVASTISRLKRTGELRTHSNGVCLAAAPSGAEHEPRALGQLTAVN